MTKTKKTHFPPPCARRIPAAAVFMLLLLFSGCGIKKTVKIDVPKSVREARTASLEDLLGVIRRYDKVESLSSNSISLTYTSAKRMEQGELEKYTSIRGHLVLKRPDYVRLILEVPVTHGTLADVLSVGDNFSVRTRDRKFYRGKNSAKRLVVEDPAGQKEFPIGIRGPHIFEAIFPQSISFETPETAVTVHPETDSQRSYYVLTIMKVREQTKDQARFFPTIRKIWIERIGLTIARQQVLDEEAGIVSDITYSNQEQVEGESFPLPLQMHIERPADGYILDLKFRKWNLNPDLGEDAFSMNPEPDDQIISLVEKSAARDVNN